MTGHLDRERARTPARRITLRAPAKVNLHLEVLRLRPDGYHEIETILQAVTLFDTVTLTLLESWSRARPQIELCVRPARSAPADRDNLCWRAAHLFCQQTSRSGHLRLDLEKQVPSGAGLGGGSSDAAAVLAGCNQLFGTRLERNRLEELGAELGSDVPFFFRGGTMLGRGRGTELIPLPGIRRGKFLLVKPPFDLVTSEVYAGLKMGLTVRSPKANISNIKALIARFPTSAWFGFNRLEEVVLPSYPVLQRILLRLKEAAPIALLSGSGSAAVAVFAENSELAKISQEFAQSGWFVKVVGPHASGVDIMDE